jgi:Zn-dependent protease with chaperone function
VVPFLTTHLGFSGHQVVDAAAVLPGLILALSAISALYAALHAARSVRRWLQRGALGPGPEASVIVAGEDVLVAAAGVRAAKVVVSTGALATLDEDELAASLAHERGHISRHHPYVTLAGNLAFGLARILPGSAEAQRRLHFFIERDADEFAVARTRNPLALASAICKMAQEPPASVMSPALARLSGSGAPARLRLLLDRSAAQPRLGIDLAARTLAAFLVSLVLAVGLLTPTLARAGVGAASHGGEKQHLCEG